MTVSVATEEASSSRRLLDVIEAECAAVCGNRERIESACAALGRTTLDFADPNLPDRLLKLAEIVSTRVSSANAPVVTLICDLAPKLSDPWVVIRRMLEAHDEQVIGMALATLAHRAEADPRFVDHRILHDLAQLVDRDASPLAAPTKLETIARIVRAPPHGDAERFEEVLAYAGDVALRTLAARLLDRSSSQPSPLLTQRLLGRRLAEWLAPYLAWTRATHLDLLSLATGAPARAVASLRRAEGICGEKLLREIIGEIGWPRLNFGIEITRCAGVSIDGSFPLLMTPCEALLFDEIPEKRWHFDRFLLVAHGGRAREPSGAREGMIARFRAFNLAHAELLSGFLDVTPLTRAKVKATVEKMDRIVSDFIFLFAKKTDECPMLSQVYAALKTAIEKNFIAETAEEGQPLSAELTRLVDMFEDPQSLAEVRTLHGLKRYLHQRGLKLGMQLAESGESANRTVTFVLATSERLLQATAAVEYVDFEEEADDATVPYAVRIVIDEFGRQLVHAEAPLPKVKVFCYGNEVHYFIAYRNHPAFVRIDYSPPGRGGMIDLAYFGVSKYELDDHPDPSLAAIERFFRRLDFDIAIDNTHVHARYDKERAFDLADLCEKAAALFRLAPNLMNVDWVIGGLVLSSAARAKVRDAWADFFATWGVLPMERFLTADRCGVLERIDADPGGEREVRWNGEGEYRDRFGSASLEQFWERIAVAVEKRSLRHVLPFDTKGEFGQLLVEERILDPLREAIARGEVLAEGDLRLASEENFVRCHPAECLTGVLRAAGRTIAASAQLADVAAMLARGLRFQTVGAINGYDVQSAMLPLPGRTLGLYVLKDAGGIFRLALSAEGESLYLRRGSSEGTWQPNWVADPEAVVTELRRTNYPTPWARPPSAAVDAASIVEAFRGENPHAALPPLAGERVVAGVAASPGRAAGVARLGLEGRSPADVERAIVVSPTISPADGAFLARSAGVVSTGGGALSHAGLLALQYGKPALVIAGNWQKSATGATTLSYGMLHYEERHRTIEAFRVTERHYLDEREEPLLDGDLVVIDADEGVLRVLGQEHDALAFHDSLRQLGSAGRQLATATSDSEILVERGRRLRARHQLEKVVTRVRDPILVRHAVSELLLLDAAVDPGVGAADKALLLELLLKNPEAGEVARDAVRLLTSRLALQLSAEGERALRLISSSNEAWEILSVRLDAVRLAALLAAARELVASCGIEIARNGEVPLGKLDELVSRRLEQLQQELIGAASRATLPRLRHVVEEIGRIDGVLGRGSSSDAALGFLQRSIAANDDVVVLESARRRVIESPSGGMELRSVIGGKAANLAEIERLGEGKFVPGWFAVTDAAFREALESPLSSGRQGRREIVRTAVEEAVARADLADPQKAATIRQAWESATLPPPLVEEVVRAYRNLADGGEPAFVAVRSSGSEEDLEAATRAGEFDTFLFVRGEEALVAHLKLAWSGLWSERALHNRAMFGAAGEVGGGIVVQRMVTARASGVLHTVNIAERRLREMVINVGLGLGEGVVSGAVAADRIVVSKEGDLQRDELHFRYLAADKRERVVFNSRLGSGTAKVETLYHQRLRPALEYTEICELVRVAARLEAAYGFPLDIEFAIEGTALYLLQVRPVPTPMTIWRETSERWPLNKTVRPSEGGRPAPAPSGLRANPFDDAESTVLRGSAALRDPEAGRKPAAPNEAGRKPAAPGRKKETP